MRKVIIAMFILAIIPQFANGQISLPKDTISVFVYKDKSITTPLNALRAELTSSLINSSNGSYVVLDRSEEILAALRSRFQYQESGLVRDDQLVAIGKQLGEKYLYVVSVVFYQEFGQYFFEGKFINMETAVNPKQALYPDTDKGQELVKTLDPQNQIRVGRELAEALGILSADEIASRRAAQARQDKARQEAIERQAREARRAERTNNIKAALSNSISDWYSCGLTLGGGSNGFQIDILSNIKFIALGVGTNISSGKYLPLTNTENAKDGYFYESGDFHEAKYFVQPFGVKFTAGFNFKYITLAVRPELYFAADENEFIDHYDDYGRDYFRGQSIYVLDHFAHTLVGVTPTLIINVPFVNPQEAKYRSRGDNYGGLIASVGYTFIPAIGYNPGFQFSIGFGVFW